MSNSADGPFCGLCHKKITPGDEVDFGYRRGPDGIEVEMYVCPECDQEVYEEATQYDYK